MGLSAVVMFERSLIRTTKQGHKLVVFVFGVVTGACLFFYGAAGLDSLATLHALLLIFGGLCVAVLFALLAAVLVRCPECGQRWLVLAVREHGVNQWMAWLAQFDTCPACGLSQPEEGECEE